ncbi:MAG TPA: hypothetical protein VMR86_09925 [Myxococcota bacterium]|nr:hypothetical protein [Myxococcota bacterium]
MSEIKPIEWYDGAVSAVGTFRASGERFYAAMLAWSPESDERVYAVVPISQDRADRILPLLASTPIHERNDQDRWNAIQSEIEQVSRESRGAVWVVRCRVLGEPLLGSIKTSIDEFGIRSELNRDFLERLEDERTEDWLSLVPLNEHGVPRR